MSKRALVAGGAGFLGTHLCERLLERGAHVTCVDNFFSGSKENIEQLVNRRNFRFVEQSVCEPVRGNYDEIFNFACPASPPHYQSDPINTFKTSVIGTLNLLDLAHRCGAKFLQASTSEVYGDPSVHPQGESYWGNVNPVGIRACYDEGKRAAESVIYDYQRMHGMNVRVVRIFNTYGPGMNINDGRVISNFIVQALRGEDITVFGDGEQTRSFCYRDDLIQGVIALMDAPDDVNFPVNIGNPGEFTIKQLAELVVRKVGSSSRLTYRPLPQDDPTQRCPDISKARQFLHWTPTIALDEGLDRTIDYFRSALSRANDIELGGPEMAAEAAE